MATIRKPKRMRDEKKIKRGRENIKKIAEKDGTIGLLKIMGEVMAKHPEETKRWMEKRKLKKK